MNKVEERAMYVKMLADLTAQRRALTEETLLVRNHIATLDKEIERDHEYMSASQYINIRNQIKEELKRDMREQVKAELEAELQYKVTPLTHQITEVEVPQLREVRSSALPPVEEVEELKFKEKKKNISSELVFSTIKNYLIEKGVPVQVNELKSHVEKELDITYTKSTWSTMMYRFKKENEKLTNPTNGYYQYMM